MSYDFSKSGPKQFLFLCPFKYVMAVTCNLPLLSDIATPLTV